jgi:hypothetical protein
VASAEQPRFRTAWGDPDLGGVWNSGTLTPLERPAAMKDREFLTEEEAEAMRGTGVERVLEAVKGTAEGTLTGELTEVWLAPGSEVVRSRRTSLVVDPPNGRIPYTPEGMRRGLQRLLLFAPNAPADGPEVRHMSERCLLTGLLYEPNPFYLNHHKIIQTPDHVVILTEIFSELRIIPIDGRAQLDPAIRRWNGSSRGYWEGDTLVVEATNFNGKNYYFGATADLHVTERFTRVDEHTIDYQATFTDPASFTQPWTLEHTLRAMEGPIYEFACHEGNYAMGGVLRGARLQEREAAEKAKDSGGE